MRHILLTLFVLFSLTACETAEEKAQAQATHDAKIIKQAREELMAELKVKEEASKQADNLKNAQLSQVGISVHEKEITINPDKAKDFFDNIGKKLEEKIHTLTKDLQKGMVNDTNTGISVSETKINIDLNKTQDFLNSWGEKMQSFVKEIDNIAKSMDNTK